jgi:hypothetical protein
MEFRSATLAVVALISLSVGTAALPVGTTPSSPGTTTAAPPGSTTADAPAETTTVAPTTTASPNASLPPGVNTTGVEDPAALIDAHRGALANDSFAFRFGANVSVGPANQWTRQSGRVGPDLSPLVVHSDSVRRIADDTSAVATDLWANNTTVVVKYHRGDRTELTAYDRNGSDLPDETWSHLPRADLQSQVTQSWLLELALAVGEYDLAGAERRDGRSVAVLRATEPAAAANVTDLNATVVVDFEGRVRSVSLTAAYEGDDATRLRYEFELTAVGNVSVGLPPWVGAALPPNATAGNATTTVAGTATTRDGTATTAAEDRTTRDGTATTVESD